MNPCDQIFFLRLPSNIWCAAQIRQNPHMNHSKQSDESRGHQSPEVGTKLHNDQSETCWDTSVWTKTMNQSTNQPTAILSLKGTVHLIVKHTLFSPLTAALSIHPDCDVCRGDAFLPANTMEEHHTWMISWAIFHQPYPRAAEVRSCSHHRGDLNTDGV